MKLGRISNVGLTILDLCGGSGEWSRPYKEAGYNVVLVDIYSTKKDVRLLEFPGRVHGVLCAPPCQHFANSGARWWSKKGPLKLMVGLTVVDACLRLVTMTRPKWWALENPVGRLKKYLGPPRLYFDPCDYGDPYTKRTCLWGRFNLPKTNPIDPYLGSWMHTNVRDPRERAVTPEGFARAFFEANP